MLWRTVGAGATKRPEFKGFAVERVAFGPAFVIPEPKSPGLGPSPDGFVMLFVGAT